MMSRYRIKVVPHYDYNGEGADEYFPQYKLWGLFWICISNAAGYASTWDLSRAQDTIEMHKARRLAKKRKVTIIEVK